MTSREGVGVRPPSARTLGVGHISLSHEILVGFVLELVQELENVEHKSYLESEEKLCGCECVQEQMEEHVNPLDSGSPRYGSEYCLMLEVEQEHFLNLESALVEQNSFAYDWV